MEVFREVTENKGIAVALGYFDGIHLGHKKLITTLVQQAKEKGIKSAIITFDKNPADYFSHKATPDIQNFKDREIILNSLGVDYVYELNFEQYKDMEAQDYLENIIVKNFAPKIIMVGYNHTFGKGKLGNPALLMQLANTYKYECVVIPEQKYKNKEQVSSSIIRKRIEAGHLNAVKALLGRYFSVRNSVIKGDGVASKLGIPTANLVWPDSMIKLPYGVYYGFAQAGAKVRPALISWGTKPTLTPGKNEALEVHIYDFKKNLYGKIIKVMFVKKARDVHKFANANVLKLQLEDDYEAFKNWAKFSDK